MGVAQGGGAAADDFHKQLTAVFAPLAAVLRGVLAQWGSTSNNALFCEGDWAMAAVRRAAEETGTPMPRLLLPLRWALTGVDAGASMGDSLRLLGREEAVARVEAVLRVVEEGKEAAAAALV